MKSFLKAKQPYIIVLLAALFYTYEYILRIEPSIMLGQMQHLFSINAAPLALMVAMYYYAYTPLQLVVGVLTDRYGPRKILIAALGSCLIGLYIFMQTHNFYIACLARILIGAGSAFAFVGAIKLAAMWLPIDRFAIFAGLCTSLGMFGAIVGDVALSSALQYCGSSCLFSITFFIGLGLLLLFILLLKNKGEYSSQTRKTIGYRSVLKSLSAVITRGEFWLVGMMGAALFLSLSGVAELWGIMFFKSVYPISSVAASGLNSIIFFGWLVGAPLVGWLSDRVHSRLGILIAGCFISALMFFIIIWVPIHSLFVMKLLLGIFGFASSAEVLVFAYVRDHVNNKVMATAASFMNLMVMFSGMVAQPFLGWMLDLNWQGTYLHDMRHYTAIDFRYAFTSICIALLIMGLLGSVYAAMKHSNKGVLDES